jgi:hypothetical protein
MLPGVLEQLAAAFIWTSIVLAGTLSILWLFS